jgi:hypothetical protein
LSAELLSSFHARRDACLASHASRESVDQAEASAPR